MKKIRLKIVWLLDRSSLFCWANLSMFYLNGSLEELIHPSGYACRQQSEISGDACWCGKFYKGKLTKKQFLKELKKGSKCNQKNTAL